MDWWTKGMKIMITSCRDCGSAEWINKIGIVNDPIGQPQSNPVISKRLHLKICLFA